MKVALLGTRGVPARYGGFETCVEEVGARLADRGHRVVVYSRRPDPSSGGAQPASYRGMLVEWLPAAHSRVAETLSHTALSLAHLDRTHRDVEAAIVFNAANAPLLPALRALRIPVATHVDGLEWMRGKWGAAGRHYYRYAESLAVRWSDALIADAPGIEEYYRVVFAAPTVSIAYGAPKVARDDSRLGALGLRADGYHLVVARFEPENHVEVIVRGYANSAATFPLVVVGSAPYAAAYTARVQQAADSRVTFLGAVWDQDLLDQLYAGATTYLHGHSVGGTNPSLLRAIGARAPTIAYDIAFNRDVLGDAGRYFQSAHDVSGLVEAAEADLTRNRQFGEHGWSRAARYDWDDVAGRYESLLARLAARAFPSTRPSGRRLAVWPAVTSNHPSP